MSIKKTQPRVASPKLTKFRFRWWMALILVVVIAVIGIVILRFSYAATPLVLSAQNGAVDDRHPSSGPAGIVVFGGGYAQSNETYQNIIGSNSAANVDHADIQVCWSFVKSSVGSVRADYSIEVLNWGGGQVSVEPHQIWQTGSITQCANSSVGSPDGNYNFFYKFVGTNNEPLRVTAITRRTLAVYPKVQPTNSPPSANTTPSTPANPSVQTLSFPAGQITTVCGYQVVGGYALICPQNILQWQFVGYTSSWVGTWDRNRALGVTSQHDSGYWKYGNFCGVKSHVVSDPKLTYSGGDHMYLVPCPTGQDLLNFKRQNQRWESR